MPLARGFLSPIRKLAHATHRLAAGDYAQRVDSTAGLGLSLCRSIVQAHGGHISAHASTLGGIRIHVVLPLHAAHAPGEN